MKRSISLSELRESLGDEGILPSTPSHLASPTMRRAKSYESLSAAGGSQRGSGASTPTNSVAGSANNAKVPMLSEKELREHFNMPLNEVAKKFGMCTTALKKLCRKYGVMQWPHRKLRSLEKKIASLKAEQRYTTDGQGHLDDEIRKLENQREALITGKGDAGMLDDDEDWGNNAGSPYDGETVEETGYPEAATRPQPSKLVSNLSNNHPMKSMHDMPKNRMPHPGHKAPPQSDGGSERLHSHVKSLEEENSSLRALSRALMTERHDLMNKLKSSNGEVDNLRNLVNSLQNQVMLLGGQGSNGTAPFKQEEQIHNYNNSHMPVYHRTSTPSTLLPEP